MDESIKQPEDALIASLQIFTPCELADQLGIHNAHIYRARKGTFSPTLIAAMRREGMIPPRPPYPYFKIRRDDHARAAAQIFDTLGREYAAELAVDLIRQLRDPKYYAWVDLLPGAIGAKRRKYVILRDNSVIEVDEDEYISMEDRGWDW